MRVAVFCGCHAHTSIQHKQNTKHSNQINFICQESESSFKLWRVRRKAARSNCRLLARALFTRNRLWPTRIHTQEKGKHTISKWLTNIYDAEIQAETFIYLKSGVFILSVRCAAGCSFCVVGIYDSLSQSAALTLRTHKWIERVV